MYAAKIVRTTISIISLLFSIVWQGFAQPKGTVGNWAVVSAKNGFQILYNKDSSNLVRIQSNGSGIKTHLKRVAYLKDEGIVNVKFEAKCTLKKGDTCTLYAIAYAQGKPIMSYSKSLHDSAVPSNLNQFARFHYLPKETDSVVTGLILKGDYNMDILKSHINLIQGGDFQSYKEKMERFANNPENIAQLATLCKTWGILKYFSPEKVNKVLDWDELLINCLSGNFQNFDKDMDINRQVSELLSQAEIVDAAGEGKLSDTMPNLVDKLAISAKNKSRLRKILSHNTTWKSKYFTPPSEKPYVIFHESNIDNQMLPDARARVLSLFRYWNIINYFYPYKSDLLPHWEIQLKHFIPMFIRFDSLTSYNESLLLLNASIGDGHSAIPLGSMLDLYDTIYFGRQFSIIPITFDVKGQKVFIKHIDPAFSALTSLIAGDELVNANDIRLDSLASRLKRYISDPTPVMKEHYLESSNWLSILPTDADTLKIDFRRNGSLDSRTINWSMKASLQAMDYFNERISIETRNRNSEVLKLYPRNKVLYINPFKWNEKLRDSAITMLDKCNHLIIDCRTYPAWEFLSFVERLLKDDVQLVKYSYATSVPGIFKSTVKHSAKDKLSFTKNIYVLISERSKSRSELLAMILKTGAEKSVTIGRRTAGADGDVTTIPLIGRNRLGFRMSNVAVEFPNGTKTQQIGIQPDVPVKDDDSDKVDEILEKALLQTE